MYMIKYTWVRPTKILCTETNVYISKKEGVFLIIETDNS